MRRGARRWPLLDVVTAAVLFLVFTGCQWQPSISVSARESLIGQGMVLTVTNTSEDFLHDLVVEVTSPQGEVKKYFQPTLEPHQSINVGWLKLDGWPIPPGAEVKVSSKGFLRPSGPFTVPAP